MFLFVFLVSISMYDNSRTALRVQLMLRVQVPCRGGSFRLLGIFLAGKAWLELPLHTFLTALPSYLLFCVLRDDEGNSCLVLKAIDIYCLRRDVPGVEADTRRCCLHRQQTSWLQEKLFTTVIRNPLPKSRPAGKILLFWIGEVFSRPSRVRKVDAVLPTVDDVLSASYLCDEASYSFCALEGPNLTSVSQIMALSYSSLSKTTSSVSQRATTTDSSS